MDTLDADTSAISTGSDSGDRRLLHGHGPLSYRRAPSERTALATQIQTVLQAAENGQAPVNHWEADRLARAADRLISDANGPAGASTPPSSPACG